MTTGYWLSDVPCSSAKTRRQSPRQKPCRTPSCTRVSLASSRSTLKPQTGWLLYAASLDGLIFLTGLLVTS